MNFKNLRQITFFLALVFMPIECIANTVGIEEAAAFSGFIQDLVQTTNTHKNGAFCHVGRDVISNAISVQNKSFVNLDSDPSKYTSCKAVYIAQGREKGLRSELDKFNKNNILTIAIFDGFVESGGMIQVQMGRRNFELVVNTKKIKESGVRLNSLVADLIVN
jgi:hypothetical protein